MCYGGMRVDRMGWVERRSRRNMWKRWIVGGTAYEDTMSAASSTDLEEDNGMSAVLEE